MTVAERGRPCRVQLAKGGRWRRGVQLGEPCKMTRAAARRRARLLGLRPRDVPAGLWLPVCVKGYGWRVVPAGRVRFV